MLGLAWTSYLSSWNLSVFICGKRDVIPTSLVIKWNKWDSIYKTPSTVFNDKSASNTIKNRPYVLNFFKVNEDGDSNEVLLNGAEFSIRNSNGTTIGYKGTESYTDEDNHTKTCYIYSTANDATYTFISGENGNAGEVCLVRVPKTNNGEELSYTITETDPAKYHTFGNYKTITLKTTKNFQSHQSIYYHNNAACSYMNWEVMWCYQFQTKKNHEGTVLSKDSSCWQCKNNTSKEKQLGKLWGTQNKQKMRCNK